MKAKRIKKKNKIIKVLVRIIVICAIILTSVYLYYLYSNIDINYSNYETEKIVSTVDKQTVENVVENSKKVADVLENTMESVVGISKLKDNGSSIFSNTDEASLGIGTGVIISKNGYILSNEHVTGKKFSTCYITLENGKKQTGTVVWNDADLDLSIVKIDLQELKPIMIGDSGSIRIGETVYAIGNPIGFEFRRTVTSGIISAINRTIKLEEEKNQTYMSDLIQTDATINPGNSGGPLINPQGEVIGINTVKISSAEGIGFAIPINVVKPIIKSIEETGTFEQATMGVYAYDKEVIPYLNSNISFNKGIYVAQVIKNGPADNTDLKEGDIILNIDEKELNTMNDLREFIYSKKEGDIVNLQIVRGKINKIIKIELR